MAINFNIHRINSMIIFFSIIIEKNKVHLLNLVKFGCFLLLFQKIKSDLQNL